MWYHLNRLDESVFMAVPKPMLTEFSIHYRLESCVSSPGGVGGVDRVCSSDARGLGFEPRSVLKYHLNCPEGWLFGARRNATY